jgi:hypothetical protein
VRRWLLLWSCVAAWGADHRNLDSGLAATVEDAYPVKRGELAFHGGWKVLELEYGIARDWQVTVGRHSGLLYNFNTETRLPAFAVKFESDVSWKAIVTKSFGRHRFHLNGGTGRDRRYEGVFGWDRPLGLHTVLVADIVSRDRERGAVEVGIRRQLGPREVFSAGLGLERNRVYFRCNFSTSGLL